MSNNGHQDILKYFKFVVFFVGRILGKQKNLFNINKLQEIFYPAGDANIFNGLHSALVTGLLCTHSGVHKMPLEIPPQGALFL